jgi:hypothetical protein
MAEIGEVQLYISMHLWRHLQWISRYLRRRLRQVARPPSSIGVVFVRSLDLPPAPSSSSSSHLTSLRLRRHLRQVVRPSYGSVVAFTSSEDLLSDFVLLAPSFYKHSILQSGGQSHAHGMAKILICVFIAQQCSVLASFSLMVLFIVRAKTQL